LEAILIHEIGHVLGVPHVKRSASGLVGSGTLAQVIMEQDFLNQSSTFKNASAERLGSYFTPPTTLNFCRLNKTIRGLFKLDSAECLSLDLTKAPHGTTVLPLYAFTPGTSPMMRTLGNAHLGILQEKAQWQSIVGTYMTSEEEVFPLLLPFLQWAENRTLILGGPGKLSVWFQIAYSMQGAKEASHFLLKASPEESILIHGSAEGMEILEADTLLEETRIYPTPPSFENGEVHISSGFGSILRVPLTRQ
jgi:hypothetical protein